MWQMQTDDKIEEHYIPRYANNGNEFMHEYCDRLRRVLTQTKDVKVGVGKKSRIEKAPKYNTDKIILQRVIESCEYYKQLHEKDMLNKSNVTFREYQTDIIERGSDILINNGFLYLAMEVRTGKTLTSFGIAENVVTKNAIFVTKKKAIDSIRNDYDMLNPSFNITIINYESLHTVADDYHWDLVILDEAHSIGAFPKPNQRCQTVRDILVKYKPRVILLSGTPTPESYSQMYHQVCYIPGNPFSSFKNFYRFSDAYVNVTEKKINGLFIKDYSKGRESILEVMKPYTISYTQAEAGFKTKTTEKVLEVTLKDSTYTLISKLKKDLVVEGKSEIILGDTPVKLMMKMHQLFSGTIKFESGNSMVLDTTKAEFIRSHFNGKKIGIFYKFKEELNALQQVFKDDLTTELSVFEDTDKSIALQIVSGREGISLRDAECLVYYNIDFSATSYWQSKDRMTTKDRPDNDVYWIFSKGGIEHDIYKAVTKKKDYTVNHFKKLIA